MTTQADGPGIATEAAQDVNPSLPTDKDHRLMNEPSTTQLTPRDAALAWAKAGACVAQTHNDGTKTPVGKWGQYTRRTVKGARGPVPAAPALQMIDRWFTDQTQAVGLIMGAVSGEMEMLEFEGRAIAEGWYPRFVALLADHGLTELWDRITNGYSETTPSGGAHYFYRLANGPSIGNTKLAARLATESELAVKPEDKIRVMIETRGEGGFVVIAPSHGTTHPSGQPWVHAGGQIGAVAGITCAERDALHAVAAMLTEVPVKAPKTRAERTYEAAELDGNPFAQATVGETALAHFNRTAVWSELLEEAGWTYCLGEDKGDVQYWLRPGKTKGDGGYAVSASLGHDEDADRLMVFSTATELPENEYLKKSGFYAEMNHGGDYKAAEADLNEQGYGSYTRSNRVAGQILDHDPEAGNTAPPSIPGQRSGHEHHGNDERFDGAGFGTDAEVARAIARAVLDGCYRYAVNLGWLQWCGKVWEPVDDGAPIKAAETFMMGMKINAAQRQSAAAKEFETITGSAGDLFFDFKKWLAANGAGEKIDRARKLHASLAKAEQETKQINACLSRRRLTDVTALAGMVEGIKTAVGELDAHPDLLNVNNGVICLWDGDLVDHHPDLLMTKIVPTDYVAGATSTDWDLVLGSVPESVQAFVQNRFGQAVTGYRAPDQGIVFNTGGGMNGKSIFTDAIMATVGPSYCVPVSAKALLGDPSQHSTEMTMFRGARVAILEELPEGKRVNVQRLKNITDAKMTARKMRQDDITWDSTHALVVNTNYELVIDETDDGSWRRIITIRWPFKYIRAPKAPVGDHQRAADERLAVRLADNRTGAREACLAWLVDGAIAWYANEGVMQPQPVEVVAASKAARQNSDSLAQWAEERLTLGATGAVASSDLLADLNRWLKREGQAPWSAKTMAQRISQHEMFVEAGVTVGGSPVRSAPFGGRLTRPKWLFEDARAASARNGWASESVTVPPLGDVLRIVYGIAFQD